MIPSKRLLALATILAALFPAAASTAQEEAAAPSPAEDSRAQDPPPIVWERWSDKLFLRARKESKGVLLTVVQPWCRPCDTADRDVYSDPLVRFLVNRSWIPVRVDAMERPDLDMRYRMALSVLGRGKSGYPVTAFLFPTGEAMWADTFIPAEDREARPGMRTLLDRMDHFWKGRFDEARGNAMAVQQAFDKADESRGKGGLDRFVVSSTTDGLIARSDPEHGGYGPPPRRQNALAARLILLASRRRGDEGLQEQALNALRGPVRGALFDRIEGGFHRATRAGDWSVPWFGKHLAVNAGYLHALADATRLTGDEELARAAGKTIDYILAVLRAPGGAFFWAQAPALEGQDEAAYYAWETSGLEKALDERSRRMAGRLFGYRPGGEPLLGLPARFTLKDAAGGEAAGEETAASRREILAVLERLRAAKTPPPVAETSYLDSTAMACSALLDAGAALGRDDAVEAALEALETILSGAHLRKGVAHSLSEPAGSPVLMVDQAHLGNALLDAYEQTGKERYLRAAGEIGKAILNLFDAPDGGFYDVIRQDDAAGYVRLRRQLCHDTVTPSPLVVAGQFFYRLGHLSGREDLAERGVQAFTWGTSRVLELDETATTLAMAVDSVLNGPVVIEVPEGEEDWRQEALALYEPAKVIRTVAAKRGGPATASICLADRCAEGLSRPGELAGALDALRSGEPAGAASGPAR